MREMGAGSPPPSPRSPRAWRSTRPRSPIRMSSDCSRVQLLSARVRLKLDAEFPLHPTSPRVRLSALSRPDAVDGDRPVHAEHGRGSLAAGLHDTAGHGAAWADSPRRGDGRASPDGPRADALPIEIVEARYAPFAPDLPLTRSSCRSPSRPCSACGCARRRRTPFQQIALDRLNLFLRRRRRGRAEALRADPRQRLGVLRRAARSPGPLVRVARPGCDSARGLRARQALIPYTTRSFSGYRLLHEYFAFPERFRFLELVGLKKARRATP